MVPGEDGLDRQQEGLAAGRADRLHGPVAAWLGQEGRGNGGWARGRQAGDLVSRGSLPKAPSTSCLQVISNLGPQAKVQRRACMRRSPPA